MCAALKGDPWRRKRMVTTCSRGLTVKIFGAPIQMLIPSTRPPRLAIIALWSELKRDMQD
jgi:hypothetical protein